MRSYPPILSCEVDRAKERETTSQGVAYLAGLYCGYWSSMEVLRTLRHCDTLFTPSMSEDKRKKLLGNWAKAVSRAGDWEEKE